MSNHSNYLEVAIELAQSAGSIIEAGWQGTFKTFVKGEGGDLVTEVDLAAENAIFDHLRERFPDHGTYGEETEKRPPLDQGYVWVVDPLDGTTNFTHKFPYVAVSIGLLHDGVPIVGVVYNPILKEMFTASKGKGAFYQGKRVHVSSTPRLKNSLLVTGFAYDRKETNDNNYREFCHMTTISHGVRRVGAAALDLAGVAIGRFDGYWERGLKPWDMAAGALIVEEAGGKVTSYEGDQFFLSSGRILASNGLIHQEMIQELKYRGSQPL